jgi:hypothetical protein
MIKRSLDLLEQIMARGLELNKEPKPLNYN